MSPEKQRIAIAEACGWTHLDKPFYSHIWVRPNTNADDYPLGDHKNISYPPDYLNDLNAMHEAEKTLPIGRYGLYRDNLISVTIRDCQSTLNSWWNATAAQRAEAFLRTIGKWEDK